MFLYRGYTSSLIGIALFRGSYFGAYDSLKGLATSRPEKYGMAYVSGLFAGLLVYPMETIRKRKILSEGKNTGASLVSLIIKAEGVRGLFRGCMLTPLQSLAGAAILLYFDK